MKPKKRYKYLKEFSHKIKIRCINKGARCLALEAEEGQTTEMLWGAVSKRRSGSRMGGTHWLMASTPIC